MGRMMTMIKRHNVVYTNGRDRGMINRMQKRWYLVLGIAFMLVFFRTQAADAASADVTVFTRAEDIHVGDTFYVMISVASEMPISDVELTVPIDSKKLKFTTGGNVATATKSKVTITDIGSDTAETSKIYALGFEAKKKGDFVFHIESPFAVYAYDAASDKRVQLSVSSNELPVTILKRGAKTPSPAPSAGAGASPAPSTPDSSNISGNPDSPVETKPSGVPDSSAGTKSDGKPEDADGMGTSADASAEPGASLSPSPSSSAETTHGGSIWTNILIGIIVVIIAGALIAAGYFIVKLL